VRQRLDTTVGQMRPGDIWGEHLIERVESLSAHLCQVHLEGLGVLRGRTGNPVALGRRVQIVVWRSVAGSAGAG
jgi:hypothetical protein